MINVHSSVVLYFVLFGLSGEPFLELIPITSQGKMKLQVDRSGVFRINSPMGCSSSSTCSSSMSSNPESVRSEVAMLKTDFNMRIKQAAFNSVCSAYYTTFVPLSFTTVSRGNRIRMVKTAASLFSLEGNKEPREEGLQ